MAGKQKTLAAATIFLLLTLASLLPALADVTLSVSLTDFFAVPETSRIVLRWETASEIGALGFNVWRGTSCDPGTATRLNTSLIPAEGDDQVGGSYEFADSDVEPNVLYHYRLEEVETDGTQYCFIEPDFQVQASLSGGNPIVTPTPPAGGGSGATSTAAPGGGTTPGSTAQPSPTPQPGQPQVTTTAAATPTTGPAGTSQPGANATPVLQITPGLETPGGPDDPGAPGDDLEGTDEGDGPGTGTGTDPAGDESGESPPGTGSGNEDEPDFEVVAEGDEAAEAGGNSGRQVIGANVPVDSQEAVSGTALESTEAADEPSGRRPLYIALMVGGLLFALGGIIATALLVFKLQAK